MALFLWPDRLRGHFFWMGVLITAVLLSFSNWTPWGLAFGLLIIASHVVLIPWITYSLFAVPVMDHLWEEWPHFLDNWFHGIPHFGPGSKKKRNIVSAYLPTIRWPGTAVYGATARSTRKAFLQASIVDMYRTNGDSSESVWVQKAFQRWLFFWCAPVWGGYLLLLVILTPGLSCGAACLPYSKHSLGVAVWLWMAYGVVYLIREAPELSRWGTLEDEDLRDFPPPIRWSLRDLSGIAARLTSTHLSAALTLVQLVGVSAYLSMINNL